MLMLLTLTPPNVTVHQQYSFYCFTKI